MYKFFSFICCVVCLFSASAQDVFNVGVRQIEIFFNEPNWDDSLDIYYANNNGKRLIADSILIDGLKDDTEDQIVISGEGTEDYAAVMSNMSHVTSVTIKEKMNELISADAMKQVNRYPCVSARIFASMSIVYADQVNFTPLLPFLLSLINAEIVSLKNKEENEVCFINKKVCFSGFDYSSTTTTVGEVVGQGGGDLCPSIEALELVLQNALRDMLHPLRQLDSSIIGQQAPGSAL